MDISGIGTAVEAAKRIIGMFFADKTEEDKANLPASLALLQTHTDIDKAKRKARTRCNIDAEAWLGVRRAVRAEFCG